MKRIPVLTAALLLSVFLSGCAGKGGESIFGVYKFKEVSYLSPLSSSTAEFLNEKMKGSKYTINEDLFKIETPGHTVEYSSPEYVKEDIPDEVTFLSDVYSFIGKDVEYQYTIHDKNGIETMWRLYVSKDCLWIANYTDNTKNGSEIIMYIYKLSK